MRKVLLAISTSLAVLGFGASASAAPYPPVDLQVSAPPSVAPSTLFTATITGCTPGGTVQVVLVQTGETDLVTCGGDGTTTTTMTSPAASGPFDITAVDLLSQSQDATVVQVQVPGIPQTGSNPDHTLQIAGIVGGTGLVLVGVAAIRRRRPAAAA